MPSKHPSIVRKNLLHHWCGPSQRYRRRRCPGSYHQERRLPAKETSEAYDGTIVHRLITQSRFAIERSRHPLEFRDLAIACQEVRQELVGDALQLHSEEWIRTRLVPSGTPDLVAVYPEWVHVVEWKCGHVLTPHEALVPQLEHQCVLAMHQHKKGRAKASCFQPRQGVLTHLEPDILDARPIVRAIKAEIAACKKADAALVPGMLQCRYCRAVHKCPASRTALVNILGHDHAFKPTGQQILEQIDAMSREEVERHMALVPMVELVVKALRDRAKAFLRAGFEVPGWELRPGKGRREIGNTAAAIPRLAELLRMPQILAAAKFSIPELESACLMNAREVNPRVTKTEVAAQLEAALGPLLLRGVPTDRLEQRNHE